MHKKGLEPNPSHLVEASGLAQGASATPLSVFALQIAFSPTPTLFAERHGNVARRCSNLLSKKNPSELVRLDYALVEASGLVRPQSGGKRSETKRYIISNYPLA